MSNVNNPVAESIAPGAMPVEPSSSSEILAATHIFTVELIEMSTTPWTRQADGLEHRQLRLQLALLERFKGRLALQPGGRFEVELPQRREDALTVSDFHGFWSHQELQKGSRYLVLSNGTTDNVAVHMKEPAITAMLAAEAASDVKLALAAEQRFQPALRPTEPLTRQQSAAVDLLKFAKEKCETSAGLFGRYVWSRVAPIYPSAEPSLLPLTLNLVEARNATVELREALLYGLYNEVGELTPLRERNIQLIRALLGLMLQPEAAALQDRLLQVPLYNLICGEGSNVPPAATVVPDASQRTRLKQAIAGFSSERAQEIGAWLDRQ